MVNLLTNSWLCLTLEEGGLLGPAKKWLGPSSPCLKPMHYLNYALFESSAYFKKLMVLNWLKINYKWKKVSSVVCFSPSHLILWRWPQYWCKAFTTSSAPSEHTTILLQYPQEPNTYLSSPWEMGVPPWVPHHWRKSPQYHLLPRPSLAVQPLQSHHLHLQMYRDSLQSLAPLNPEVLQECMAGQECTSDLSAKQPSWGAHSQYCCGDASEWL